MLYCRAALSLLDYLATLLTVAPYQCRVRLPP